MSQRELAERLQVQPSFISAIENGKSRMPDEKTRKLKEIFELDDFEGFLIEDSVDSTMLFPPHTHSDPTDTISQLLNHFHDLAHKNHHGQPDAETEARIDYLMKRNDRLSERVDELRDEVDRLKEDNLRLKELLIKNGIEY